MRPLRSPEPLDLRLSLPDAPLRFDGLRRLDGPSSRPGIFEGSPLGGHIVIAFIGVAVTAALRDGAPWAHPDPWIVAPPAVAFASSTMLGLTAALAIVGFTRLAVARFGWAQSLYGELRPVAQGLGDGEIFAASILAAIGEEAFFRALLVPTIGVVPAALLFGLAHQVKMRGPTRWAWTLSATIMGLVMGSLFALTGSIVGPVLAHAVINAANLVYLKAQGPEGARR